MTIVHLCISCNLIRGVDSKSMLCDECAEIDKENYPEPVTMEEP